MCQGLSFRLLSAGFREFDFYDVGCISPSHVVPCLEKFMRDSSLRVMVSSGSGRE